jgi:hypothetical protein
VNLKTRPFDVARALLDCICVGLASTAAGCPGRRCVVPGNEIDFVNCCGGVNGGQLTVNLESMYASRVFPVPDTAANKCDAPYEVVSYSVTVLRCVPVGDLDHPASCTALETAASTIFADQLVVREAVRCCLEDTESFSQVADWNYRWILDEHASVGPEGGCAGSILRVVIGMNACHDCSVVGR